MSKITHGLCLLAIGSALSAGACAPLAVGAVATGGMAMAQERSIGDAIDDMGIQIAIGNELYDKDDATFRQVDLEVVEGRVLMTGRVQRQDDRIEASRVAWSTNGVEDVINEIEVADERMMAVRPNDVWISTRLRARLVGDAEVRQINYHIQTQNGTVYLFGIARDEAELIRATDHARNVRGVQQVISHVRLREDRSARPGQDT